MVNEHAPDLIVLDVMRPRLDGLEVLRRVRAMGNTPVIMLAESQNGVTHVKATLNSKPFDGFRVEFFFSTKQGALGTGDGAELIGTATEIATGRTAATATGTTAAPTIDTTTTIATTTIVAPRIGTTTTIVTTTSGTTATATRAPPCPRRRSTRPSRTS